MSIGALIPTMSTSVLILMMSISALIPTMRIGVLMTMMRTIVPSPKKKTNNKKQYVKVPTIREN